jgi:hypothetical protein
VNPPSFSVNELLRDFTGEVSQSNELVTVVLFLCFRAATGKTNQIIQNCVPSTALYCR